MRLGMEIDLMEVGDIPIGRVDYIRYRPQKQRMFVMATPQPGLGNDQQDQLFLQQTDQQNDSRQGFLQEQPRATSRQSQQQDFGLPRSYSNGRPASAQQLHLPLDQLQQQQQQAQQQQHQQQQAEGNLSYLTRSTPRSPRTPRTPKSPRRNLFYLKRNQNPQEVIESPFLSNAPHENFIDDNTDQSLTQNEVQNFVENGMHNDRSFLQKVNPAFLDPFMRRKKGEQDQSKKIDDINNNSESVNQQPDHRNRTNSETMAEFIPLYLHEHPHSHVMQRRNTAPTQLPLADGVIAHHDVQRASPHDFSYDQNHGHRQAHQHIHQQPENTYYDSRGSRNASRNNSDEVVQRQPNEDLGRSVSRKPSRRKAASPREDLQYLSNGEQDVQDGDRRMGRTASRNNSDELRYQRQNSSRNNSTQSGHRSPTNPRSRQTGLVKSTSQKSQAEKPNQQKVLINSEVQVSAQMVDQEVLVEVLKPVKKRDFWAQVNIDRDPSRSTSPRSSGSVPRAPTPTRDFQAQVKIKPKTMEIGISTVENATQPFQQSTKNKPPQQANQQVQVEIEPSVIVQEKEKIVPFVLYVDDPQRVEKSQQENEETSPVTPPLQTEFAQQQAHMSTNMTATGIGSQVQDSPKFAGEDLTSKQNVINTALQDYDQNELENVVQDSPRFIPPHREASINTDGTIGDLQYNQVGISMDIVEVTNRIDSHSKPHKHSQDFQFQLDTQQQQEQEEPGVNNLSAGIKSFFENWRKGKNKSKNNKDESHQGTGPRAVQTEPLPEIDHSQGDSNSNNADRSRSAGSVTDQIQDAQKKQRKVRKHSVQCGNDDESEIDNGGVQQQMVASGVNTDFGSGLMIQRIISLSTTEDSSEFQQSLSEGYSNSTQNCSNSEQNEPKVMVSVGTDPMESLLNRAEINKWRIRRARDKGVVPFPPPLPPQPLWTQKAQEYRARRLKKILDYQSNLTIENVRTLREAYFYDEDEWEEYNNDRRSFKGSGKGSGKGTPMKDDPMYLRTATRGRVIQPSDILSRSKSPTSLRSSFKLSKKSGTGGDDRVSNYSEEILSQQNYNQDNLSDMSGPVSLNHVEVNYDREIPKYVPEWASVKLRSTMRRSIDVDVNRLEQEIAEEEEEEEEQGDLVLNLPDTVQTDTKTLAPGMHHSVPAHQITPKLLGEAIERRQQKRISREGSLASILSGTSLRRVQQDQQKKEDEEKTQLDGSLGWKVQALIGVFDFSKKG
eukprot:TRINITY_DN1818_c1_g2_i1.p1 TRINITY_DN1818_c1_g2~~TRINITY_DN1818_c1_g2_i1.p1  ORF type:complete len:1393 (+),score=156.67 TRINITY_DN1818_c1_g2_i1:502-4179(+)